MVQQKTWSRSRLFNAIGIASLATCVGLAGCTRGHYREEADFEAGALIYEKSNDPRWQLCDFTINLDPRSRYYDPYDPDRPPMPPDDPASHTLMHCVDEKKGWSHWHDDGNIEELENPYWREQLGEYLPQNEDGEYILSLERSVDLALIHLPRYQQTLETIYLSALDVSTERFRFDVQFFGGDDVTNQHLGAQRTGGEANRLTNNMDLLASRRFSTAATLLVNFANSFVWNFSGADTDAVSSLLGFSFIQPLLRAGGRAVAMEQLTLSERALLANLRAFQQYRQGFYSDLAVGDNGNVPGPRRRGGFLGGTGLTGFSGTGGGGFGGVGQATGFGRGGFGTGAAGGGGAAGGALGAGGGAGTVGGFIGLLQIQQQLRNQEDNLNLQLRTLALLEANAEAGLIGVDQVLQFKQSIETERANLLQSTNTLANSLENFKTGDLGLPVDLPIALDDSFIQQFQLIDPRMSATENDVTTLITDFGELPADSTIEQVQEMLTRATTLSERVTEQLQIVLEDLGRLDSVSEERQKNMTSEEVDQFVQDRQSLLEKYKENETLAQTTAEQLQNLQNGLTPQTLEQSANNFVALNTTFSNVLGELTLIQVRARLESVLLDTVELESDAALEIARANRLDWMNNRAGLVDSWRLITFNANALLSVATIALSGDVGTQGDNPFDFRGPTGRLTAALQFDAPLTRLIERNNFRQQLIEYQQTRRQVIQFEDGIFRRLRQTMRGLKQLELNLEIQRRAVAIAILRVDQSREELNRPVPPALPGQPPAQFGPTATRDLVDALEALRDAQNNFMSVWLNYYAGRMALMREIGLMQIDSNGLWIDVPLDEAMSGSIGAEYKLPPEIPDAEWAPYEGNVDGQEFAPAIPEGLPMPPAPAP